jgi:hypothetical protein
MLRRSHNRQADIQSPRCGLIRLTQQSIQTQDHAQKPKVNQNISNEVWI